MDAPSCPRALEKQAKATSPFRPPSEELGARPKVLLERGVLAMTTGGRLDFARTSVARVAKLAVCTGLLVIGVVSLRMNRGRNEPGSARSSAVTRDLAEEEGWITGYRGMLGEEDRLFVGVTSAADAQNGAVAEFRADESGELRRKRLIVAPDFHLSSTCDFGREFDVKLRMLAVTGSLGRHELGGLPAYDVLWIYQLDSGDDWIFNAYVISNIIDDRARFIDVTIVSLQSICVTYFVNDETGNHAVENGLAVLKRSGDGRWELSARLPIPGEMTGGLDSSGSYVAAGSSRWNRSADGYVGEVRIFEIDSGRIWIGTAAGGSRPTRRDHFGDMIFFSGDCLISLDRRHDDTRVPIYENPVGTGGVYVANISSIEDKNRNGSVEFQSVLNNDVLSICSAGSSWFGVARSAEAALELVTGHCGQTDGFDTKKPTVLPDGASITSIARFNGSVWGLVPRTRLKMGTSGLLRIGE